MLDYATLKSVHIALVAVSVAGFVARAVPSVWFDRRTENRWLRTAPHAVDTVLLATGIALAVMAGWRPLVHPWLGWKLVWLVDYIVFAMVAMRGSLPRGVRIGFFAAALVAVAQLVATAVTKSPWGLLA